MIRVLIADDHNLVRKGIRSLLEESGKIEVIYEASDGAEAVEKVTEMQPDIAILDLSMPRLDGLQASEKILGLGLNTQIIILSIHSDPTIVHQLLKIGVKGYLKKDALTEELIFAVDSAVQRKTYLSPTVSEDVMPLLLGNDPDEVPDSLGELLTPREREVLQLVAEGHTNQSTAHTLGISVKTVEKHRANLMSKLNVDNLPALIRKALKHNLIFMK
ncbi:MAG: response regulator transcription factor [Anaerolineales bacterium]|nr:response regulator transcription factor [Anaerolineales bacterium]